MNEGFPARQKKLKRQTVAAFAVLVVALTACLACQAQDAQWSLEQSSLTYHVSHPVHQADGVSHAAHGKGACHAGECDFEISAPVKSFDSGSGHRDRHMLKVTDAEHFPDVTVHARLPESMTGVETILADLEIEFAGGKAEYKQIAFVRTAKGDEVMITGTIPAKMSDFQIKRPSLFGVPTKDEIPVRVEMTWKRE